jgi:O-antigen/teichoic acid export membrane protein
MPIKTDNKYEHLFDTSRINKEVKSRSIKAGLANLISQGFSLFITLVRAAILARLLTPEDYGVFTMVVVVTHFALIFKDLGLSTAIIREKEITHAQVSNLFWINTLVGLFSMAIVIAVSPVIVWFYHDNRLSPIALVLSVAFLFGGLSVQHQALLKRQMEFGKIALVTIFSSIFSSIIGVVLALLHYDYWALVWMNIATNFFLMAGFWYFTRWKPGLPVKGAGTKKIIKIGFDVAGLNAFSTLTQNIDKIIAGRISNASLLGLFSKGNQVPQMVSGEFRMAFFSVALPALGSLQSELKRFAQYYYKFLNIVSWVTMPLSAFCFVFADEIIQIYFGSQWAGAAIYMTIFSLHSFLMPAITTLDQVPLALGNSRKYLFGGITRSFGTILCVVTGAYFYGIVGIAIGVSIANLITFIPFFVICVQDSPITGKDYFKTLSIPSLTSIVIGVIFYLFKTNFINNGIMLELIYMFAYLFAVTTFMLACDFFHIGCQMGIVDTVIKKINSKGQK